jgi:hypothetical protein
MAKILCNKSRKVETPWAIFKRDGWEYKILKNYQKDPRKAYARWFCSVKSPYATDLGDTYVTDVLKNSDLDAAHPDFLELMGYVRETCENFGIKILGD